MSHLSITLNEADTTAAIEGNLFEYWLYMAQPPILKVSSEHGALSFISNLSDPYYNTVMAAKFTEAGVVEHVDAILDTFASKGLPMTWWITPSTQPLSLGAYLRYRGLDVEEHYPAMALNLTLVEPVIDLSSTLRVTRVQDSHSLAEWMKTYSTNFEMMDEVCEVVHKIYEELGFDEDSPLQHYSIVLDGKVVATSTLFIGGGVAGIWGVTTLPEVRRQGFGRAITLGTLLDAKKRGLKTAILFSSTAGLNLYRQIGFREVFQVTYYTGIPVKH